MFFQVFHFFRIVTVMSAVCLPTSGSYRVRNWKLRNHMSDDIQSHFVTWNVELMSSIIFKIVIIMQGTVNSPSLFNIYTHKVPTLFNANRNNNIYSTAFTDDYLIFVAIYSTISSGI